MRRTIISILTLVVAMLSCTAYAGSASNSNDRKLLRVLGFETPEAREALKTFGFTPQEIEEYYDGFATVVKNSMDTDDEMSQILQMIPSNMSLFAMFNRENGWTLSHDMYPSVEMVQAMMNMVGDVEFTQILLPLSWKFTAYNTIKLMDKEAAVGADALMPIGSASPEYRKKLGTLLDLLGEKENMRKVMVNMVSKSEFASRIKDVEDYFNGDNLLYRLAVVYSQYLTEDDLDQLIEIYSSPKAKKLIDMNKNLYSIGMNVLNGNFDVSGFSFQTNQDAVDFFVLDKPAMRKYQAAYWPINYASTMLQRRDMEKNLNLKEGSLSQINGEGSAMLRFLMQQILNTNF